MLNSQLSEQKVNVVELFKKFDKNMKTIAEAMQGYKSILLAFMLKVGEKTSDADVKQKAHEDLLEK